MSSTIPNRLDESTDPAAAGVARSEPGGRAKRRGGGGRSDGGPELSDELKALLPDELLDELLAGARTEEEITGPGGLLSQLTRRLGAGAGGRADRPSRLRARPGAARRSGQHAQRVDAEDAHNGARAGTDRHAP